MFNDPEDFTLERSGPQPKDNDEGDEQPETWQRTLDELAGKVLA